MSRPSIVIAVLTTVCFCSVQTVSADVTYNILPQQLTNESDHTPEFILGGTLTVVDDAHLDGVLSLPEIVEARIENTMSGLIWAYDDYDFTNIDLSFSGQDLIGRIRIQDTATGMPFVDWGGGDLVSISNPSLTQYASGPWDPTSAIARRAIPEPTSFLVVLASMTAVFVRRKRK